MALPEITKKKVDQTLAAYCKVRIPPRARDQIRLGYEFRGDRVILFEERPSYRDPSHWTNMKIAQFRFNPETQKWALYCRDRNSKWHLYKNITPENELTKLIAEIDRDPTGIFWG